MIKSRIKQGLVYIFGRYDDDWDSHIRKVLDESEFKIFSQMGRYDRIHSYKLFKEIQKDYLLKDDLKFWKLGLLHDCGKESIGLIRRVKKVLFGDVAVSNHTEKGYIKLKDLDRKLALLIREHHDESSDVKMKRFQELDDR